MNDKLAGGGGPDNFVYIGFDGKDTIKGFSPKQNDLIDLWAVDANTDKAGNQKFKFIGDKEFTDKAGQLRFDNHKLQGDWDGDGKAELGDQTPRSG